MSGTYPVGAFFVVSVRGWVGFLIALAQLLCMRPSAYMHAGIIVAADGTIVEAEPGPGGARVANLREYTGRTVRVCDGPVQSWAATTGATFGAVALKRQQIALQALALRGTRYSVLDYFALACLHLRLPSQWIRDRVKASGHMICSQLTDETFRRAGIHLFSDPKRLPGDSMPSDLADWADAWEESCRAAAAA